MTLKEKHDILKKVFWDTEISGRELYSIIVDKQRDHGVTQEKVFLRMLERLGWHTILDILGVERVKSLLTVEAIGAIRQKELRERYEFIRKILYGEALSFTGWGDAYYQKVKHTLLSHRWYRAQQALL
ncbi:MAG: hypothetical protein WBW71_01150 [Bacteroidota bacterium]